MVAAKTGNLDAVKELKSKEIKLRGREKGKEGYTSLMYAAEAN